MQLKAENIKFRYSDKSRWILNDVSLTVNPGERIALTGPSGYGKSTLAKIISGYVQADEGQVLLDGKPLPQNSYCPVQMVFQHPEQALNPRWKLEKSLNEFLVCDEISTMLDAVTQAQIWRFILEIADKRNMGLIVVTHNMALAEKVCDRIIYLPELNNA